MDRVVVIGRDTVPSRLVLGEGEKLTLTLLVLPGVSCDILLDIEMNAPGAVLDLAGLYLCRGDEKVRISVNLRHNAPGCESHQMFKGIVDGRSRAEFDGLIYVTRDAQKTKAYQESHTILLSGEAFAQAQPQLEIYADDVECSHGATTGYLDAQERFYMQSRGIPEQEARRLQMVSFISGVASRLPEELQTQVYDALA